MRTDNPARTENPVIFTVSLLAAFGSWLMQQPQEATWLQLNTPINVGSLLVGVSAVVLAAYGVNRRQS